MVAYSFKNEFAEAVQLYTGMRTSACRKLVDPDPTCTSVRSVRLYRKGLVGRPIIAIDGMDQPRARCLEIAMADGFDSVTALFAWFDAEHGLPFEGVIIEWRMGA